VKKVTEVTTKKEEDIATMILKYNGNLSAVARSLKIARKTVYARIQKSDLLKDAVEDARETILDEAEDALGAAIKKGEPWAVCFTLKTLGKKRGYIEKSEVENSGKQKIEIEYVNDTKPSD
jgi:GTP cyclohydrolase II